MEELRLGFLSSHGGSNMQAIIDACTDGRLTAIPCVVISNNSRSAALKHARREGIPGYHMSGTTHPTLERLDKGILETLIRHDVNLIILAGYMKLLGLQTVSRYQGRILNVHPALLPKFGGKGYYGKAVHEAVLAAGEAVTGVTVHLVDDQFDHGATVAQCQVPVRDDDTVDSLAERVLVREHEMYIETLQRIAQGELDLGEIGRTADG